MNVISKDDLALEAAKLGFVRIGFARAEPLAPEGQYLTQWLSEGRHGTMDYMQRTRDVRIDPTHEGMLPTAASIIVLITPYGAKDEVDLKPGRIAKYARGRDYHNVLYKRTHQLARKLQEAGYPCRVAVDSMPVFERAWAERAGVGFIGKNCCLIVPGYGSHVFISAVVTSAAFACDKPMKSRCGGCTLCLQQCPTQAFVAERQLDSNRCISYLTIEHRGAIDADLQPLMGDWLYGCDACQDVCPFNHGQASRVEASEHFAKHKGFEALQSHDFLEMDEDTFSRRFEGSPLRRGGAASLRRNALIVLANVAQKTNQQP